MTSRANGVALVIPTIERPLAVQRLVRSARRHLPELKIYVGDQSHPDPFMQEFYRENDVTLIGLPYDCGVADARNRIVEHIKEEYFLLCDDDFVLTEDTSIDDARVILMAAPDVGVVGGKLVDAVTGGKTASYVDRLYEMHFFHDVANRLLVSVPLHMFAPEPRMIAGLLCYPCDALLNFALFRTAMFSPSIRWDARFKSDGEHEDFYLNLKTNSAWSAVYLPTMVAEHERPASVGYQRKRQRTGGWSGMMRKWGIDQYLEYGAGLRTCAEIGLLYRELDLDKERFLQAGQLVYSAASGQREGRFEIVGSQMRLLGERETPTQRRNSRFAFAVSSDGALAKEHSRSAVVTARHDAGELPFLVVTRDQPQAVQRLIRSVRSIFPKSRVLVADHGAKNEFMDQFYRAHEIEIYRLPAGASVSTYRRALVDRLGNEEAFVACSDNMGIDDGTTFDTAIAVLRNNPDIGVVGGRLRNTGQYAAKAADAYFLEVDHKAGLLVSIPIHHFAPRIGVDAGTPFYRCDAVGDFAVLRRSTFEDIQWDCPFTHEAAQMDFYLTLKSMGGVGVAYLPSLTAHVDRGRGGQTSDREWRELLKKWGLRQVFAAGTGLRTLGGGGVRPPSALRRASFFQSSGLQQGVLDANSPRGAFDVSAMRVMPLNAYSEMGQVFDPEAKKLAIDLSVAGLWPTT